MNECENDKTPLPLFIYLLYNPIMYISYQFNSSVIDTQPRTLNAGVLPASTLIFFFEKRGICNSHEDWIKRTV